MEHAGDRSRRRVIGNPDPVAGEIVKAYVALRAGYVPSKQCCASN